MHRDSTNIAAAAATDTQNRTHDNKKQNNAHKKTKKTHAATMVSQ